MFHQNTPAKLQVIVKQDTIVQMDFVLIHVYNVLRGIHVKLVDVLNQLNPHVLQLLNINALIQDQRILTVQFMMLL